MNYKSRTGQEAMQCLNELIDKYYSELKRIKIELQDGWFVNTSKGSVPNMSGEIYCFKDNDKYIIACDASKLMFTPGGRLINEAELRDIYRGVLSHELSHIVKAETPGKTFWKRVSEKITNNILKNRNEIKTDDDVIRRGLGYCLLEAKEVLPSPNGYSISQLKKKLQETRL